MTGTARHDAWSAGQSYDEYMGRWSRRVADAFLRWLGPPTGCDWLDVGCGTGALTAAILATAAPRTVTGVDPSTDFVDHATAAVDDPRASFHVGSAESLPLADGSIDVVTSALAYNFVPHRPAALAELQRVTRPGGWVALYVWDYPGGGVEFIDRFWKAAASLDPSAAELDEAGRFPFCTSDGLEREFVDAGLANVEVVPIEVATPFVDFPAFWHPFTLGAGPAPGYLAGLDDATQVALRSALESELGDDASHLTARAWSIRGRK